MQITKRQLRRIIQEIAVEVLKPGMGVTTNEQWKQLQPGDIIDINGRSSVVVEVDSFNTTLVYVDQGKSTLKDLDYRYAMIYPEDPPDMIPEIVVKFRGPGPPPKNVRSPRRKTGAGRSFSIYD
jgi:hypothetical protein